VAGSKIAAVERREARVPGNNGTRHLPRCQIATSAFPALRSLTPVREGRDGGPHADQTTGAMNHVCLLLGSFARECELFEN